MGTIAFVASLALPWLLGAAAVAAPRAKARGTSGDVAWIAGAGYLTGAFLLTLWMRVLSMVGVRFGLLPVAAPLLALTIVLAWVAWRNNGATLLAAARAALRALIHSPGLSGAARLFWRLAVGWLALRFALLGLEVGWQPLYPWDAWIQWATKARVWYELGHIVPFARTDAWLAANGAVYFDASPEYPPTMPLLQVWANLALGRWDDALMNWPWWQIALALTLAVYGGLRALGADAIAALAGAFVVASLPLANAHVALAGYADLPLAAYYTVAALALLRWCATRETSDAILAAALAVATTQIKNPGVFWALTLVPGVLVSLLPRHGLKVAAAGFVLALLLLALLAQADVTIFNYRLHLDFDPAWLALGESYFLQGNWNLLWYAAIAVAVLAWRDLYGPSLAPVTVIVTAGLLFLFVVFGFTTARNYVTDQTTVNRATLHLAPLIVVFLVLAFRAFAERWVAAHPAPAPRAAA